MKNNLIPSKSIIEFLHEAGKLKNVIRFSEAKNMPKDSAADHSWRTSLMALIIADNLKLKMNIAKLLELAIVHDIVEAVIGNIDYVLIAKNKISKNQKKLLEKKAINKLKKLLPPNIGKKIYGLWSEYENNITKEAKFIHALNKLETLIYLSEVGYKNYDIPELIPNYADEAINNFPALKYILKEIKGELKKEFKKGGIVWKKDFENIFSSE